VNAVKSITITRIFDAPRKLVFEAWLDEKHLQQWWSPRGFTNPVCKVEGRAGGSILIHMAHPDFGEMPMGGKYEEVSPIDKIVFTTTAFPNSEGVPQLQGYNIVLFSDEGKKTKIVLTASIIKAGPGLEAALAGMDQGWSESLDRLGELVEDTSDREMSITRVLDAPRELVWKVWTDPAHVREWWGPNGFTNTIHKMDVSQGGEWLLTMHGPDGTDYPNHIRYLEIIKNERIIYDHGQPEDGGQFRTFVTFTPEGARTRVTMKGVFKTVEFKQMIVEKYGALEGQKQHFARMEDYVKKIRNIQENI
jgi:uncharacterized protein YndB with AHSA1/START domain